MKLISYCFAFGCAFSSTAIASPLTVGPVDLDSGTFFSWQDRPDDAPATSATSLQAADVFLQPTENVGVRTNAALGQVGASAQSTNTDDLNKTFPTAFSEAVLFDTLSFDFIGAFGSGFISFDLEVSGFMDVAGDRIANNFGSFWSASIFASVQVVDVTDLDAGFFLNGVDGGTPTIGANSTDIRNTNAFNQAGTFAIPDPVVDAFGTVVYTTSPANFCDGTYQVCQEVDLTENGRAQDVSFNLSGSFTAFEDRDYALLIKNATSTGGFGTLSADFLGTSTFRFATDPDVTIFSASGDLPGTVALPAAIPLGGTIPFLATGVLVLLGLRRRSLV